MKKGKGVEGKMKGIPTTPNQLAFLFYRKKGEKSMGEGTVMVPMSEYRKMVDTETRVKMMLDYMAHHEQRINSEDIYLFLGMPEDAEMVKEEREKLLERYQELTVKGIEVIAQ